MAGIRIAQANWDGLLFPVPGGTDKIMITISGSEGGLEHSGKTAKFFSDNGIPALAFSLFKTKHSPGKLSQIPIEQLGAAITYLLEKGYGRVGVQGVSKGAEYALAAAIALPEISFVNVRTPSWFYSEGLFHSQPTGTSCWTLKGEELPYTPYKSRKFNLAGELWKHREFNILAFNEGKDINPDSVIRVEEIKAPILIQTVRRDTIWPSAESGEKLAQRLEEHSFAQPYKLTCFEHMSHMMLEYCGSEIRYFIKSERQYLRECAEEREQMGAETLEWVEKVW